MFLNWGNSFRISPYFHRFFKKKVDAAAEMYRETIQWRESFNLQQVMSDYGTGEVGGWAEMGESTQKLGFLIFPPEKTR